MAVQSGARRDLGIAILGGTFDPVHHGHLRVALEAREALGTAELRLLPAGVPPHRPSPRASARHRLEMLRLAVSEALGLVVDDREVRRPGNSYMVDTLDEIRAEAGQAPLFLLVGQDAANGLDEWHEWRTLFELAHLVIFGRPDSSGNYGPELARQMDSRTVRDVEELRARPAGNVLPLAVTQLDISSTDIRDRLASGRSAKYLLPDACIDYIAEHGIYGSR